MHIGFLSSGPDQIQSQSSFSIFFKGKCERAMVRSVKTFDQFHPTCESDKQILQRFSQNKKLSAQLVVQPGREEGHAKISNG